MVCLSQSGIGNPFFSSLTADFNINDIFTMKKLQVASSGVISADLNAQNLVKNTVFRFEYGPKRRIRSRGLKDINIRGIQKAALGVEVSAKKVGLVASVDFATQKYITACTYYVRLCFTVFM